MPTETEENGILSPASGGNETALFGRPASGKNGTTLFGRLDAGENGTALLGRPASGGNGIKYAQRSGICKNKRNLK